MDFGEIGKNLVPLIGILVFMLASIFLKRRRGGGTQLEMVVMLLSEINQNLKLADAFSFQWKINKFKTRSWQISKNKLDFLDQPLQTALSDAFGLAEGFNREIDAAKKYKSSSYLASIQVGKLSKPLAQSKEGLERWLQESAGKQGMVTKRRSLFG